MTPAGAGVDRDRRVAPLLAIAALLAVVGIVVPAGSGWDFANFYDTGRRVLAGELGQIYDPSALIQGQLPQGSMAFWGAPLSALAYAPLGLLSPLVALVVFKTVATLAAVAALGLLYAMARRIIPPGAGSMAGFPVAFVAMVFAFQPLWSIYRVGGQTTPLVLLVLVLALRAHLAGRFLASATWLLVASLFKPTFVLVPAVLVLLSPLRFLVALAAVGSLTAVGSIAWLGWPIHAQFLHILTRGAGTRSPWVFNSALTILPDALAQDGGIPAWLPSAIRALLVLAVLAVLAALAFDGLRSLRPPVARRALGWLVALSSALLLAPVVWEHYLAVLIIPLALMLRSWPALSPAARVHLVVIVTLCVPQNLIFMLWLRDRVPAGGPLLLLVSIVKAGPLLAYLAFLGLRRRAVLDTLQAWPDAGGHGTA